MIGAGVGGLSAAAILSRRGHEVVVLERSDRIGGKLRVEPIAGRNVDAGPTVLTMRWALERVFDRAGSSLSTHLSLTPLETLARHFWRDGASLDLFADPARTAAGIEAFSDAKNAEGYLAFARYAARIWELVRGPFIEADRPTLARMLSLAARIGPSAMADIDSTRSMWKALGSFFTDPRLLQLFGRYATYAGSSPFTAPATLHSISHVEREGVFSVDGGMHEIARALGRVAEANGARIHTGADVAEILVARGAVKGVKLASGEVVETERVLFNGDVSALGSGLLGAAKKAAPPTGKPSLSAVTVAAVGRVGGLALERHNVFFSPDYPREFDELERGEIPSEPTIYLCAEDRIHGPTTASSERLFVIVNAPPGAALGPPSSDLERRTCERMVLQTLHKYGLTWSNDAPAVVSLPRDFALRFPGTGGAIYGAATMGMWSSFSRAASRSSIDGLYLAGGSVHPGAGVPMAAISGTTAADSISADLASTSRWRKTATPGGTSMPSATTVGTPSS